MATRDEIFPSRFLKAGDLNGKAVVVEIEAAPTELLGSGADAKTKTVLYFNGPLKPLVLNMTNWDSVAAIAGGDTDDWPGRKIELFPTSTTLKGQTVDCIRIRPPRTRQAAPAPQTSRTFPPDRITSGPQTRPATKHVTPQNIVPPADDDLDDSIPFN
jgi:hypothetical protein